MRSNDNELVKFLGRVVRAIGPEQGACVVVGLKHSGNQGERELLDVTCQLLQLGHRREMIGVVRLQILQPPREEPVRPQRPVDPPRVIRLGEAPARLEMADQRG